MQRYKIKIEYEGTPFVGWQFQKNGQSVQEVLQKAIFNFSKEKVVVIGAGRTDSGVHALAQVAHFDLKKKIKKKSLLPAINQNIGNKPVTVLKINKANKSSTNGNPGTVLDENLTIACKLDSIQILEIQRQGKNKQVAKDFLIGKKISKGSILA